MDGENKPMSNRKPDFIIIGAAKAGTTSLHHHLNRHPSVFMSTPKEPSYFAYDERYARGDGWYLSLFENAKDKQICGEASTNYTNWPRYPDSAERMHALLPDIKLIYIMRHPVERAYSHYLQLIDNIRVRDSGHKFTDTFEQHIEKDDSVLLSSNYMLQINRFLQHYPRNKFLFLFFEDFIHNQELTLERIFRFLEIDIHIDMESHKATNENRAKDKDAWLIRSQLTQPLRALPGTQWVADHLSQNIRDKIYKLLFSLPWRRRIEAEFIPPKMKEETRNKLLKYFEEPNQELATFLDTDLNHWNS